MIPFFATSMLLLCDHVVAGNSKSLIRRDMLVLDAHAQAASLKLDSSVSKTVNMASQDPYTVQQGHCRPASLFTGDECTGCASMCRCTYAASLTDVGSCHDKLTEIEGGVAAELNHAGCFIFSMGSISKCPADCVASASTTTVLAAFGGDKTKDPDGGFLRCIIPPAATPTVFPDTPSTCMGTMLECPDDANVDPCSTAGSCTYLHHRCPFKGSSELRQCSDAGGTCLTGVSNCHLRCEGSFIDEYFAPKLKTTVKNPSCNDLALDACQQSYISDKNTINKRHGQYVGRYLATQCKLHRFANGTTACTEKTTCALQETPANIGPPGRAESDD